MNCREAQEQILEALTEPHLGQDSDVLDRHLGECDNCREFLETQRRLDLQLSLAISAPDLNPQFRDAVMARVRRQPHSLWPESLPDIAHLIGCFCATILCFWLLPFSAGSICLAGLVLSFATYFVQSVVRSALETWESQD